MTRTLKLTLAAFAAMAIGLPAPVAGQGSFKVDPTLAKQGKKLFNGDHGCYYCHKFGGKLGAPDLAGIMERRDHAWLRRWLKETDTMLQTDPQALAMLEQYRYWRMPKIRLSDADVEALFHYMAQETERTRRN